MTRVALGRILVTDDEAELMTALVEVLNEQGFEAVGCSSGAAALDVLREQDFDLLLTDLMMPEMDGITLLQAALAIDPQLVGLLMTGQGTVQTAVEAMKVGAFDYLLKPFKLQTLMPIISRALQVRRLRRENLALRDTLAIYELGQAVTRTLDLPTILEKLADAAMQQCRADEVSILLPTEDQNELYVAAVRGGNRAPLLGHRLPIRQSPAGWVAQHQELLTLAGPITDPRFRPELPRSEIQSALVYPLLYGGKFVGVLCANSMIQPRPPTLGELKALDLLISIGGAAIENASLYAEARKAEAAALEAEQVVRENAARFRAVLDSAHDAIICSGADGTITYVNAAARRAFGYAEAEMLRHPHTMLIAEPFRETAGAAFEALASECEIRVPGQTLELTGQRKDRSEFPLELSLGSWETSDGPGFVAVIRDLTRQKMVERALRESEELHRSVVENLSEGIVISSGLTVSFVNEAFLKIHGLSDPTEVLGKSRDLLVAPDDRKRIRHNLLSRQRGDLPSANSSYRVLRPDGEERLVEVTGKLIVHRGHPAALSVLHDVTDQKRAEEALRQSEERLRQAQKMEAIGQLAGGVAHDFNNLLTAIIGFSALVRDRLPSEDPNQVFVQEIATAGERAAALTRQLLAFSRQQVLQPHVLDLNTVVGEMDKLLGRVLGEDVDLVTVLNPDLALIEADPGQLEQIILNLAVNARDAMPNGGKLTIETANVELDATYASQHLDISPGDFVLLAVSDTGVGMDAATQARIFEPFFTTKEVGKGTGLGLSTVFGIVKQSEGGIWVYSEPGQGTTFKIYLPRTRLAARSAPVARSESTLPTGTETVLLVEDEPAVRNLARTILESLGYQVWDARHAEEAISLIVEKGDQVDMLITDLVMPDMGGRELAEQLLARHPSIKVLFMSGFTGEAALHQRRLAEGMHFIQKPFTPLVLARQVRSVLDG